MLMKIIIINRVKLLAYVHLNRKCISTEYLYADVEILQRLLHDSNAYEK